MSCNIRNAVSVIGELTYGFVCSPLAIRMAEHFVILQSMQYDFFTMGTYISLPVHYRFVDFRISKSVCSRTLIQQIKFTGSRWLKATDMKTLLFSGACRYVFRAGLTIYADDWGN